MPLTNDEVDELIARYKHARQQHDAFKIQHEQVLSEEESLRLQAYRAEVSISRGLMDKTGACVVEHEYRPGKWATTKWAGAGLRFPDEESAIQYIRYLRGTGQFDLWFDPKQKWRVRNEATDVTIPGEMLLVPTELEACR